MNHKERIDAVMNFQPVDRTPFALVDGGAWVAKHEGLTYRELYSMPDGGASIIAKYMDDIDTDTIGGVNGVFTAPLNAFGCEIEGVDTHMHGDDEYMDIEVMVMSAKIFADAIIRICGLKK